MGTGAFTKRDVAKLRSALSSAKLPTDLSELGRRVREGADAGELDRAMAEAAESAVGPPPALPAGPAKVAPLPDELIRAAVKRAITGDRQADPEIDRVVTSHAGFFTLTKRYGALSDPQTELLAGHLASAARGLRPSLGQDAALRAGEHVAYRTQALVHLLRSSRGPEREALAKKLGTIVPAASPVAPVNVRVTPYRQRDAKVGSLRIRYIDVNQDSQEGTILLVHGHGSLLEEYDDLTPLLAKRYRVIVPDLPGCGYSDKPERKYSVGFFARTLVGLLDVLGVHRAVVAGGSLGGNLSLRLGLEHPERFPTIASWAPAGWIGTDDLLAFGATVARGMGSWIYWLSYNEQKGSWYSKDWPGAAEAVAQSDVYRAEVYCPAYHHAYFDIAAEQTGTSWAARAKDIEAQTLLMCGEKDDALEMWKWVSTKLAKEIPRVTFQHRFKYGRHSLAAEDTEQLATYILRFLDEVAPATAVRGRARRTGPRQPSA